MNISTDRINQWGKTLWNFELESNMSVFFIPGGYKEQGRNDTDFYNLNVTQRFTFKRRPFYKLVLINFICLFKKGI